MRWICFGAESDGYVPRAGAIDTPEHEVHDAQAQVVASLRRRGAVHSG